MEKPEVNFNDPAELDEVLKEHGAEQLKNKKFCWKSALLFWIKVFLLFSCMLGIYAQAKYLINLF